LPEPPALKNHPIVAVQDGYRNVPQRPEARQAGGFDRPLGFFGPSAPGELMPDECPIMAVNRRRQMHPDITPAGNVRHIYRPPFVASTGLAYPATHSWAWRAGSLMDQPPFLFEHPIHRLLVHDVLRLATQQRPELPIYPKVGYC